MAAACTDWVKKTVDLGAATGLAATFNNGARHLGQRTAAPTTRSDTGDVAVEDGVVAHCEPCAAPVPSRATRPPSTTSTATTGLDDHTATSTDAPTGGSWTTVPGVGMEMSACTGWWKRTLDLEHGHLPEGGLQQRQRRLGDNNSADLRDPRPAPTTVKDHGLPRTPRDPARPRPPTPRRRPPRPKVTASATHTSIVLSWDASTDDKGVTKYQVTRTGGTKGIDPSPTSARPSSPTRDWRRRPPTRTAVKAAGRAPAATSRRLRQQGDHREKAPEPASGTPSAPTPARTPSTFRPDRPLRRRRQRQQPRRQPAREVRQRGERRPDVPRRLQGPHRQARLHQGARLLRGLDHPGGAEPLRLRLPRLPRLGLLPDRRRGWSRPARRTRT